MTAPASSAHSASSPRCAPSSARARRRARRLGVLVALLLTSAVGAALIAISPAAAGALGFAPPPRTSPAASPLQWRWPVPPPIRVVAPFRAPATRYSAGHRGIDVLAEPGARVVAAASGTVSFAGPVAGRSIVAIDHGDGVVSAIEPVEPLVAEGAVVATGDAIGTVSTGGHCDPGCVHFGVRIDAEYVSPFLFLGGIPRAVLLPLE